MANYDEYYNAFMNQSEEEIRIGNEIEKENERFEELPEVKAHRAKVNELYTKQHDALVERLDKAREIRPRLRIKTDDSAPRLKKKVEYSPELESAIKAVNELDRGDKLTLGRVCFSERIPDGKEKIDDDVLNELHHILVQTVIDFVKEKDLKNVWAVRFSADSLQDSANFGIWSPETDSYLGVEGIEDVPYTDKEGKEHSISGRVIIGESY